MKLLWRWQLLPVLAVLLSALPAQAQKDDKTTFYPTAVLQFQERGKEVKDLGAKVTDLVFANLVANPDMYLVDRDDLKKILDEQELNISGVVNPSEATQVGQLTGAKILVTGSVLQVGDKMYVIAKIIGTETSRVVGTSVKGKADDDLDTLVEKLAAEVGATIKKEAKKLIAPVVTREDRLAALAKKLDKGKRPAVVIDVTERHVGQTTFDPAAETELALYCRELGFTVIDTNEGDKSEADLLILGEGFSEFATRRGNLVSVKARLEVKIVERSTGRVLAVDRQTTVAVDLTEQIAGKTALQEAAAKIAERVLPKVATVEKSKKAKTVKERKKKRNKQK